MWRSLSGAIDTACAISGIKGTVCLVRVLLGSTYHTGSASKSLCSSHAAAAVSA